MKEILGDATRSPNIAYNFVDEIVREYDSLKKKFVKRPTRFNLPTTTWRDDDVDDDVVSFITGIYFLLFP